VLQEHIQLGQRVTAFRVFAERNGKWAPLAEGTTIGYKRILRFAKTETEKLKIEFEGRAALCISEVGAY
jgi:alpha-L-fucosidase